MAGDDIATEVQAALVEAGQETGNSSLGLTATLTRPAPLPDDPWDAPAGSEQTWTVQVLVTEYERRHIDGEQILMGDKKILMDALGPRPAVADTITVGDDTYTILNVMSLEPGGVQLLFTLQARK